MKKPYFPLFADVLFYSLATGLLALCTLRVFALPFWLCVTVSIPLAVAVGIVVFVLTDNHNQKRALTKRQEQEYEALMLHLALERPERIRALFVQAFTSDGKEAQCAEDGFFVDGVLFLSAFTMQPLSADCIARFIRQYPTQPFTVSCNALTPEAEKLLARFGKNAFCGRAVYELLQRTDCYPHPLICGEIPRVSRKERFFLAFAKENARPFFVSGILLLFMSLFTFFPLYYLISGGVLLFISCAIRLFARPSKQGAEF